VQLVRKQTDLATLNLCFERRVKIGRDAGIVVVPNCARCGIREAPRPAAIAWTATRTGRSDSGESKSPKCFSWDYIRPQPYATIATGAGFGAALVVAARTVRNVVPRSTIAC